MLSEITLLRLHIELMPLKSNTQSGRLKQSLSDLSINSPSSTITSASSNCIFTSTSLIDSTSSTPSSSSQISTLMTIEPRKFLYLCDPGVSLPSFRSLIHDFMITNSWVSNSFSLSSLSIFSSRMYAIPMVPEWKVKDVFRDSQIVYLQFDSSLTSPFLPSCTIPSILFPPYNTPPSSRPTSPLPIRMGSRLNQNSNDPIQFKDNHSLTSQKQSKSSPYFLIVFDYWSI